MEQLCPRSRASRTLLPTRSLSRSSPAWESKLGSANAFQDPMQRHTNSLLTSSAAGTAM
jgi:hypothetical protein